MKKISVEQFEKEWVHADVQCLDVREKAEYRQIRSEKFELHPLSQLSETSVNQLNKDKTTYLLCRSGNRACQAADRLEKMGFKDLRVIEGGIGAFELLGKPLLKSSGKTWSLERQVRFAAGVLVLTGIFLMYAVHPAGIALSAFVAGGLIFSALTDTCGMGLVLAQMPWNQK